MEHALMEDSPVEIREGKIKDAEASRDPKFPFRFATAVYLLLVAILGGIAVQMNGGMLVYTLDDPYIHLALAENLWNGHYGVNMQELSAPSSSILWPFIIAPFAKYELSLLIINILCSIGAIYFASGVLDEITRGDGQKGMVLGKTLVLTSLVFGFNLVGLTFIGMEHSLQVMLVLAVAYGLVIDATRNCEVKWMWIVLILAGLVRYEVLAIVLAALGCLFYRGRYRQAAFAVAGLAVTLYAFTLFLYLNGMGVMPTSIVAKSQIGNATAGIQRVITNLLQSFSMARWGAMLSAASALLLVVLLFFKGKGDRRLALCTLFASVAHLVAGQYGWYNRYEVYIVAFVSIMLIYLFRGVFLQFFRLCEEWRWKAALFTALATLFLFFPYVSDLFSLPVASNNIYEQQYQMHRFVTDYYKKPVAVNDLGWVAYKNDQFVLDLVGLASVKVLETRKKGTFTFKWLNDLTEESGVNFAMVYDTWFSALPPNWKRIGVLQLGRRKVTPAEPFVSFYSLNRAEDAVIREKLKEFVPTLPDKAKFTFVKE